MRQLLSWEGGGFRVAARKTFLMVPASMLGVTLNAIFLPTFFCQKSWKKCWILLNSNFLSKFFCPKSWKKVGHDATRQNRVADRVFEGEKLDNELNIKWERTFLMTCSKTGDVFLRQRLYCLMLVYRQADTGQH